MIRIMLAIILVAIAMTSNDYKNNSTNHSIG